MTSACAGAPSRCSPVGSRATYGCSSAGESMSVESASRSASERCERKSSGASDASVPKSGLASSATTRIRSCDASRFPSTNEIVVLPTPPLGEITATVFGRVIGGTCASRSSTSPLSTLELAAQRVLEPRHRACHGAGRHRLAGAHRSHVDVLAGHRRARCRAVQLRIEPVILLRRLGLGDGGGVGVGDPGAVSDRCGVVDRWRRRSGLRRHRPAAWFDIPALCLLHFPQRSSLHRRPP